MSQNYWRWCTKCQGLFFSGNNLGFCPAGGAHDDTGSANYVLASSGSGQSGWKWCTRCQGLWFADDGAAVCPAHPHSDLVPTNYVLHTSGSGQYWKWCNKCQGLFFAGNSFGVCADLGTHDDAGSITYVLSASGGGQSGWRWCNKCQSLFYAGNGPSDPNWLGLCPAGGTHDESGSGSYDVPTSGSGQSGWRLCISCQGLFYSGNSFGVCSTPVRTSHSESGSANYVLSTSGSGQSDWRWCKTCQGMFFAGKSLGVCPAGGSHDSSGSANYVIEISLVLPFEVQSQLETNWCWAAVAASISQFIGVSKFTQCQIVNLQLGRSDCCSDPSSSNCNQAGYLSDALQEVGCFSSEEGQGSYGDVSSALATGLPPCVRIGWSGGGGHFIVIKGLEPYASVPPADFLLLVSDPTFGDSWVTYDTLINGFYQGTGSWTDTYFTTAFGT